MAAGSWVMLCVFVVFMAAEGESQYTPPPGMATRITRSGFQFLQHITARTINDMARGRYIRSRSGQSGAVSYRVWSMRIRSASVSSCYLQGLNHQTLMVRLSDIYVHVQGQYQYNFLVFHGKGPFDAFMRRMIAEIFLRITADSHGRPQVRCSGCRFTALDVEVRLHNEWGLISNKASNALREFLNENACRQITEAINYQIEKRLFKLTMLQTIHDGLELDYSLLSDPHFSSYSVDTLHKGEVYAIGHHSEAPVNWTFIPLDQETTSMVYVWISDYLFNSACYVLHDNDYLQYDITQQDIPEGSKFSLNSSGFPVSKLFPEVQAKYPNMMTQFHIRSTKEPAIKTSSDKMTLSVSGDVKAYVISQNDTEEYLFTLNVNLTVSAVFEVQRNNVTWKANYESVHLQLEDTAIPDMDIKKLQNMLPIALKLYVMPMVNGMGRVGKPIPAFQHYHATATNITFGTGFLKIGTDFRVYNPIEERIEDLFNSLF